MKHPVKVNPVFSVIGGSTYPVPWRAGQVADSGGGTPGTEFPENLLLFWKSSSHSVSIVGEAPQYTGTPVVDAAGVAPGYGPTFQDISALNTNGTLAVKFTATKNSADIVGEEHIFGPIYADKYGLICNDGANKARFVASFSVGSVVTAIVQIFDGQMSIGVEI